MSCVGSSGSSCPWPPPRPPAPPAGTRSSPPGRAAAAPPPRTRRSPARSTRSPESPRSGRRRRGWPEPPSDPGRRRHPGGPGTRRDRGRSGTPGSARPPSARILTSSRLGAAGKRHQNPRRPRPVRLIVAHADGKEHHHQHPLLFPRFRICSARMRRARVASSAGAALQMFVTSRPRVPSVTSVTARIGRFRPIPKHC